jgi:hypothetical protein
VIAHDPGLCEQLGALPLRLHRGQLASESS